MSTIDNAKKALGWVHSNARPACGNCAHVKTEKVDQSFGSVAYFCNEGGFCTPRYAICDKHEPLFQTGGTRA